MQLRHVSSGMLFAAGALMVVGSLTLGPDGFAAFNGVLLLVAGVAALFRRRWTLIPAAVVAALSGLQLVMLHLGVFIDPPETRMAELMAGPAGWVLALLQLGGAALALAALRNPAAQAPAPARPAGPA